MKKENKFYKVEEIEEGHVKVTYFPERENPVVEEFQVFQGTVRLITDDMGYKQPMVYRGLSTNGTSPLSASKGNLLSVIQSEAKTWCRHYQANNPS